MPGTLLEVNLEEGSFLCCCCSNHFGRIMRSWLLVLDWVICDSRLPRVLYNRILGPVLQRCVFKVVDHFRANNSIRRG